MTVWKNVLNEPKENVQDLNEKSLIFQLVEGQLKQVSSHKCKEKKNNQKKFMEKIFLVNNKDRGITSWKSKEGFISVEPYERG